MPYRFRFSNCTLGTLTGLALGLAASGPAIATDALPYDVINADAAHSAIHVISLRRGVDLLQGSGGNIGVFTDGHGTIMVDSGIAISKTKLKRALESLDKNHVRYVVNTHWHWDHADGDAWLHESGATIVAHPNTARHLAGTIRVEEWGHTFVPVTQNGRPTQLVNSERTLAWSGEQVRVRYYGPSHTDGDLSVYFSKADVLFTGDIWWNGLYPFIDYKVGGSIEGMIRAAEASIAMTGTNTIVVPGHGPAGSKSDLTAYRDMLVTTRNKVADLKKRGMTLEQTIAAHPTASFDAKWGHGIIGPALFTTLVYRGV